MMDFEERVLAEAEDALDTKGIRRVFSEMDAEGINSNTMILPLDKQDVADTPIDEGELLPRAGSESVRRDVTFEKFGYEVTDDSDEDISEQAESLATLIAFKAADEIYDEVPVKRVFTTSGPNILDASVAEAMSAVPKDEQDTIVVSDVLATHIENKSSRGWNDIVADLEEETGVDIVVDEYNTLGSSDVLVVDRDRLGYEITRTPLQSKTYDEYEEYDPRFNNIDEEERTVVRTVGQAYTRRAFTVVDGNAGVILQFGQI